jgi:hypothetical protein
MSAEKNKNGRDCEPAGTDNVVFVTSPGFVISPEPCDPPR